MNFNLTSAAAIATAALAASGAAFAQTGTLDQSSPQEFVAFTNGQDWQQEIEVGLDGQLEGVTLYFFASQTANTTVSFNVYETGTACNPGNLVFSDSYTVSQAGVVEETFVDLTALNLNYTVGDVFLLEFFPAPNTGEATFLGNGDKYANGSMCGNGVPYQPGDAAFMTYMNPGSGIIPDIQISGNCPGPVTVDVTGVTPNGRIALLFGASQGSTIIPPNFACAGTQLGITAGVQLVNTVSADANGEAQFVGNAPPAACGRFLQVLDLTTCNTSNVIQVP
ncbi:MAG: hypothetical protein ACOC0P_02090 [Planctomycetota bacterium]